jgi:Prophage CP4-57 regulatory protein (AlpA)
MEVHRMQPKFIRIAELATTPAREGKAAGNGQRACKAKPARHGRLPVSPATVWRWVKRNEFPAPARLGEGVTAWRLADVEAWESKQQAR